MKRSLLGPRNVHIGWKCFIVALASLLVSVAGQQLRGVPFARVPHYIPEIVGAAVVYFGIAMVSTIRMHGPAGVFMGVIVAAVCGGLGAYQNHEDRVALGKQRDSKMLIADSSPHARPAPRTIDQPTPRERLKIPEGDPSAPAGSLVPIRLPSDVTVELPRNWTTLTDNCRTTIDTAARSMAARDGVLDASSDLKFAATLFDDAGQATALFNVRYYPDQKLSQSDAETMSASELLDLDTLVRTSIEQAGRGHFTVTSWRGTERRTINGIICFVSEYTRTGADARSPFCARLVRVFNAANSHTLTVSYRTSDEPLLRPICDRIISSLRHGNTTAPRGR